MENARDAQSGPAKSTLGKARQLWHSCLLRLYENLTSGDSAQPVDLIFVMAGRMDRKQYGLELYRAGIAPCLVLSIGRFEVSKMSDLDLEGVDQLIAARDNTRPDERHFFLKVDSSGTRIENIRLLRWSTYGEALGLRQFLEKEKARRVIVISTDVHLRRVALTFASVFRRAAVKFLYCRVPCRLTILRKQDWWLRSNDRRFVITEAMKLVGYRLILSMPAWAIPRLMRLKQ